jgi:hypothetical protein
MTRFKQLQEFESRFESMSVDELRRWKKYWTEHPQHLASKVRKQAMKRVHKIDKKIAERLREASDAEAG